MLQPTATTLSPAEADRIVNRPADAPLGMLAGDQIPAPNFGTSATAGAPAGNALGTPPAARRTLLGVPMMTPSEKLDRDIDRRKQLIDRARGTILPALQAVDPTATIEDALALLQTGQMAKDRAAAPSGFSLGPDETRFDPTGKEIARGRPKPAGADAKNIDDLIVAAYNAKDQPELNRLLALKQQSTSAGRAPSAADAQSPEALATMAADNPAVLQGLTPTVVSGVMQAIAKNPALRARFEGVRMGPIRDQAQTIVGALQGCSKSTPAARSPACSRAPQGCMARVVVVSPASFPARGQPRPRPNSTNSSARRSST